MSDDLLAKIGRVTVNAVELELALACLARHLDATADVVASMKRTGQPLRSARAALDAEPVRHPALRQAVENAEKLLEERHATVHSLWVNDLDGDLASCRQSYTPRAGELAAVDLAALDAIANRMAACTASIFKQLGESDQPRNLVRKAYT